MYKYLPYSVIYYYLCIKTFIKVFFYNLLKKIIKTRDVKILYNDYYEPQSVLIRYYMINIINRIVRFLNNIKEGIDIKVDKIQVTNITDNGYENIIMDSKKHNSELTISNFINHVDFMENKDYSKDNSKDGVFVNFELFIPSQDPICLKKYISNYINNNHHTLSNIVIFNDIKVDNDSRIKIKLFKNGKFVNHELSYNDVSENCIEYFYLLE